MLSQSYHDEPEASHESLTACLFLKEYYLFKKT
jgi:hypothetical protein